MPLFPKEPGGLCAEGASSLGSREASAQKEGFPKENLLLLARKPATESTCAQGLPFLPAGGKEVSRSPQDPGPPFNLFHCWEEAGARARALALPAHKPLLFLPGHAPGGQYPSLLLAARVSCPGRLLARTEPPRPPCAYYAPRAIQSFMFLSSGEQRFRAQKT